MPLNTGLFLVLDLVVTMEVLWRWGGAQKFKSKMVVTVTEAVLSLGGWGASVGPRKMGRSTHRRQGETPRGEAGKVE